MRVDEFRFKLTDKVSGVSAILTLNDLYGYEGEVCGVLIKDEPHIPNELRGLEINLNSGYGYYGINENIDVEYVTD